MHLKAETRESRTTLRAVGMPVGFKHLLIEVGD